MSLEDEGREVGEARRLDLTQERSDVDAAVRRRVRAEAPRRLLELPLAADTAAAPGLVPRHRDVDEPLEEIALVGRGRPPRVFQRLVRGEVLAGPQQLQPLCERRLHRYFPIMATILLAGVDLFMRGKLDALLPGHHLVTTDSAYLPDLVICDIARIDPEEVADAFPEIPILGYTNHTDTSGLRAANAAGFDQVIVKSALVERAPQLVDELTASLE
jgi:hypothetical protein